MSSSRKPDGNWLRGRFANPAPAQNHWPEPVPEGAVLRPASVLIPVIERDEELTVLFTRRTEHLQGAAIER